jgi:hypothetical protein
MRRRIIELCLLAYPRSRRRVDGEVLRDLALDLADTRGTAREAFGLLRGGLAERRRLAGRARRAVVAVGAMAFVGLGFLSWSAAADGGRVEEDRFACVGECAEIESEVAQRERAGWNCTERREPSVVTWRCSLD